MDEYIGYIILGAIIIAIIGVIAFFKIKKKMLIVEFITKYNLMELSKEVKLNRKSTKTVRNYFELNYPYWLFSNRDGTKDKRRNGNRVVWQDNFLYIDEYVVKTANPYKLVLIVNEIRDRNKDLIIEKCREEQKKYEEIYNNKKFISKSNEIQNIINQFKDNPTDFETFTARLFQKMGYNAMTTSKTNDGGFDIVLHRNQITTIVECKCYAQDHNVSRPLIQKLVGANQTKNADRMIFVTTSDYTVGALKYANETGVETINGKQLSELIVKYYNIKNVGVKVNTYEWELDRNDIYNHIPEDIYEYI